MTMSEGSCEGADESTILVGSKPVIAYVVAALMEITKGGEVTIRARGRHISKAVDTVQVIRTKYLSGSLRIEKIKVDSEPLATPQESGDDRFVSSIEIVLSARGSGGGSAMASRVRRTARSTI